MADMDCGNRDGCGYRFGGFGMSKLLFALFLGCFLVCVSPLVSASASTDSVYASGTVYSGSSTADADYACWTGNTQKITVAQAGNWTDAVSKASSLSSGETLYVPDGTYTVTSTMIPPSDTQIIFAKGAEMQRGSNFNTESDDHLIQLGNDRITLTGGRWNGMNVTASSGLHFVAIQIGGSNIVVKDVEVFDLGTAANDGDDAGISINTSAIDVRISNSFVHDNHFSHCFQILGQNVIIESSTAQDCKQDGFRAYQGGGDTLIVGSHAIRTRAGFQAWASGERNINFVGTIAVNSSTYGYNFVGIGSSCSGCSAIGSNLTSLRIDGDLNVISGFYTNGTKTTKPPVVVTGDRNSLFGINGELKTTTYGFNITGNENRVVSSWLNGATTQYIDSGNNNEFLMVKGSTSKLENNLFLDGDLGVGKTPSNPLHVLLADQEAAKFETAANDDAFFEYTEADDHGWRHYLEADDNKYHFQTKLSDAYTTVITIPYSGSGVNNVMIGSTNPSTEKLGVTGNFSTTGEVKLGGVSSDGVGKVLCVKSDATTGTCTSDINATGFCTCA